MCLTYIKQKNCLFDFMCFCAIVSHFWMLVLLFSLQETHLKVINKDIHI